MVWVITANDFEFYKLRFFDVDISWLRHIRSSIILELGLVGGIFLY